MHIGITSSQPYIRDDVLNPKVAPYARAVESAGGEPVLLVNDVANLDELLATLGGIVVTGGVDVDPARYGGRPDHSRSAKGTYRADRDEFEIALLRAALERGIPTLCICRGMQIANVAFGGTLIEDIGDVLGERAALDHLDGRHEVTVEPDSALSRVTGALAFQTNSRHHQAVRNRGGGLTIAARTSDGIVEALEATVEHPYFLAVQWHPEDLNDDISRRLFATLIAAGCNRGAAL
ncbi:MAG: gamma-glutamyl-gamma-aminobutyrate hydrolase family protein [Candidatus Eremiobacteraeota bacterium]|nr:gamma-glutamyl-gamma-aminobutyrate hydrolase family protein [Candidatus Eremiobacteraeota bacterium]MBC5802416.1 gamma-glutamyl-gamma-aminobutyrate hydrolase family protein [Candidatus Eremiobacteraeota bacterium]